MRKNGMHDAFLCAALRKLHQPRAYTLCSR